LKGVSPPRRFELRDVNGWTSCGPIQQFDVFHSYDDTRFVVFVKGAYPTQEGVLEAIKIDRIVDPAIKAALAKAGY